jgi:hypothetical protein
MNNSEVSCISQHATCVGSKCTCQLFYMGEGCCERWDQEYHGWTGTKYLRWQIAI